MDKRATPIAKKHTINGLLTLSLTAVLLSGCSGNNNNIPSSASPSPSPKANTAQNTTTPPAAKTITTDEQPSTVYYEIFVRSFYDSDGDGIGDLKGITKKLDYLNDGNPDTTDDLGIGGIWLMPINPSPSYHGYDVTDYRAINPDYGTIEDLQELVTEAHKRGIKVIMDLVVNHTSKEHPWFVDSAKNKDSKYRDWYIWAEDQGRPANGASAAGSGSAWHSLLGSHYLGGFWEGMPDLNFDHTEVRNEMKDIGKFWLEQGVDGFRLDAAKHIYEDLLSDKSQATTNKNVSWWQDFRKAMNEVNPQAYIVGEVWENSAVTVGAYLDQAFDSSFNFGLAETLINSVKTEKDSGTAFTLERTYNLYSKISDSHFTDAIFLTNHDQNRVMSQLDSNLDHAKMAAALLLTLPGNPFIYYGEEIGMLGVKPDEGIREPMRWMTADQVEGQTTWEVGSNNADDVSINVESQTNDSSSLLKRYRELIALRNEVPALRDGGIRDYTSGNAGVMAYERITTEDQVLVVHNLTGDEQIITLHPNAEGISYTKIQKTTADKVTLNSDQLTLPPYSTVIVD
ncbi:alpha-amylase [Paenibacillus odorifer]|jgi:alpha-amylase|uniref:alpha-amylase family glycosyl hydrolase n=1 Tax=Paenibacillus TaxID=44249 RepID=UPI00096CC098|nr:alpha-amylase family glycosyl hydrolase [Paenibacillus odorifer]OMD85590.1 alpha-amylase [Paenibacillus odorifer]